MFVRKFSGLSPPWSNALLPESKAKATPREAALNVQWPKYELIRFW